MSKNPRKGQATLSKKHLDRMHREQKEIKWITIVSIIVIILVVGIIGYGILNERVLRGYRSVAVVNGEKISANEFKAYTKYYRSNLIQNAEQTYQIASLFSNNSSSLGEFGQQLVSIAGELDTFRAGNSAIDQMVADRLIRQEAKKRGITVSAEEVETSMQEALRYFANGTPIPTPTSAPIATSTLSPTQLGLIPPTATLTPTIVPTTTIPVSVTTTPEPTPTQEVITATATPRPTATAYTFEAYQEVYATTVADYEGLEIPEATLRYIVESDLFREKVQEAVLGEVSCTEEQVWAQHILVADEQLARDLSQRLKDGEDWFKLAAEYSTDTSNKDSGGDLGWFGRGKMVKEFEDAAFSLFLPGQISPPVNSQFGWHIIRLVSHEDRPLTDSECAAKSNNEFNTWLENLRSTSEVDVREFWREVVPIQPTLRAEIQTAVQQLGGQSVPEGFPTPAP